MHSSSSSLVLIAFAALAVASSEPSRMERVVRSVDPINVNLSGPDVQHQTVDLDIKPICVAVVPANTGEGSVGTAQSVKRQIDNSDCSLVNVNATPITAKNLSVAHTVKRQAPVPNTNVAVNGINLSNNEIDLKKRTLICAEFSGVNVNNATILRMKRDAGCDHDFNLTGATADNTRVKGPKN
ncbi:hypothetical protein RQP46_000419 [Phenoliferia psychrophenolica]